VRPLEPLGVLVGSIAFLGSFTPSLLPRSWVLQGLGSGLSVVVAYAIGAGLAWVARHIRAPSTSPRARRRIWYGIATVAAVLIPVSLWLGAVWQNDVRRAVHMPPDTAYPYAAILSIACAVFIAALAIARAIRAAYIALAPRPRRLVPSAVLWTLLSALLVGLALTAINGVLYRGFVAMADASSSFDDGGTDAGVARPDSPLRSGSPASLVSWGSLGIRGRDFVAGGPTAADIERLTGRPAIAPIRVYAGTASAGTLQGEANLVLAELKRTGAFNRELLAIGIPPGEGGLDEHLTAPVEYMYGGDTAIAAMQYSHLQSWVSFVSDPSRARDAARTLFGTVYAYWSKLPLTHRPRVVICGMSLGALGAADAFPNLDELTRRTSGALFVGPPDDTELLSQVTEHRVPGTPERLPVYDDGRTVRFAASASDLRTPTGSVLSPRVVVLQHATDPIVWWSPTLLWSEPQWLREPRGPGVVPAMHWFPVLTFWQISGDLRIDPNPPSGYGHNYDAAEIDTAWAALLHPPGWTDADTAALAAAQSAHA
jgi:uncharacterized membrane protein